MAITSYATYYAKQQAPAQAIGSARITNGTNVRSAIMSNTWLDLPSAFAGAIPAAAAVPTNATLGALGQLNGTNLRPFQFIAAMADIASTTGAPVGWRITLADRLSHQGGLSGTAVGAQTTNLPTAALTRYTSGVGVRASFDVYVLIGNTIQSITASYTNQDGTGGRTSFATEFGGPERRSPTATFMLPLAAGDTGVRSVESATLSASTGTVGNFGVTLWKPLLSFNVLAAPQFTIDPLAILGANLPVIQPDACLYWIARPLSPSGAGSTFQYVTQIAFGED